MKRALILIPLLIFLALAALLAVGLTLKPTEVPSPLIGKPVPAFSAPSLSDPEKIVTDQVLRGRVSVLNVWASWCIPCRDEHPYVQELNARGLAPVIGLNYKDKREDASRWLKQFGNAYTVSASDLDGRVGLDWGVYGVPETFIIDHQGIIRYKHIGPITAVSLREEIIPTIERLRQEAGQ